MLHCLSSGMGLLPHPWKLKAGLKLKLLELKLFHTPKKPVDKFTWDLSQSWKEGPVITELENVKLLLLLKVPYSVNSAIQTQNQLGQILKPRT